MQDKKCACVETNNKYVIKMTCGTRHQITVKNQLDHVI